MRRRPRDGRSAPCGTRPLASQPPRVVSEQPHAALRHRAGQGAASALEGNARPVLGGYARRGTVVFARGPHVPATKDSTSGCNRTDAAERVGRSRLRDRPTGLSALGSSPTTPHIPTAHEVTGPICPRTILVRIEWRGVIVEQERVRQGDLGGQGQQRGTPSSRRPLDSIHRRRQTRGLSRPCEPPQERFGTGSQSFCFGDVSRTARSSAASVRKRSNSASSGWFLSIHAAALSTTGGPFPSPQAAGGPSPGRRSQSCHHPVSTGLTSRGRPPPLASRGAVAGRTSVFQ